MVVSQSGAGARVRQTGGGDGRDVGRGCGVVGGGRAALRVVCYRPAECATGPVDLLGGRVSAAFAGGDAGSSGRVLRVRASPRRAAHALLYAPAVVWRVSHAHDQRARTDCAHVGVRVRRRRAPQDPYGDGVLSGRTNNDCFLSRVTCVYCAVLFIFVFVSYCTRCNLFMYLYIEDVSVDDESCPELLLRSIKR